ncbi:lipopolysaccharide transport periplasmic protein LptA [Desulfurivibrio sp. D14AmB]|uniref:lipopolysaccharide transport periplasmic protein LptA n=1 Tax=Desulfurivibrio sp. D14AmB TaxID=3374370 RepID=UPI00376F2FD2
MTRFVFLLILGLTLLPGTTARSEQGVAIQIESDRMESVGGENAVLFSGQVVARKGDLVVHADGMTVHYLGSEERAQLPAGDERRLQKLFAVGNVKVETPEWVGTGQRLDYFEIERKVHLTGDARIWQGNNLVTGEAVTIYLEEGRSVVERSERPGERVRAFFYADDGPPENGSEPGSDAPVPPPVSPAPPTETPANEQEP